MSEPLQSPQPNHVDPKASLSTPELVRLLMDHCHETCNKRIHENVEIERSHTNDKLEKVAGTLTKAFTGLVDTISKNTTARIDHLAERLTML